MFCNADGLGFRASSLGGSLLTCVHLLQMNLET
uniref:Uncharacterized protein n=1 Tax=Arundo donax TaxID=35708 RepID=A0A0A9GPC3_ARUDO